MSKTNIPNSTIRKEYLFTPDAVVTFGEGRSGDEYRGAQLGNLEKDLGKASNASNDFWGEKMSVTVNPTSDNSELYPATSMSRSTKGIVTYGDDGGERVELSGGRGIAYLNGKGSAILTIFYHDKPEEAAADASPDFTPSATGSGTRRGRARPRMRGGKAGRFTDRSVPDGGSA